MYEIERKENMILVRRGQKVIYSAPTDSYLLYRERESILAHRVSDFTDEGLLVALANSVDLPIKASA